MPTLKINNYSPLMLMVISMFIFTLSIVLMNKSTITILEFNFMSGYFSSMGFSLIADFKGTLFSGVVLFIAANVLTFSNLYMSSDKFIQRFTILVLLFVLSMNLLIYVPNLIMLLLGWDGLGIISFILVIYYQNPKSLAAGMITAITNRIGDVMILLCIALTMNQGHWNIMSMFSDKGTPLQMIFLLIAASTKSAQMPFSSWLPAAMAAPTPVSALVHSSTLVTAGVFLLLRFYPFMHSFKFFNMTLMSAGVITMTLASFCAMMETDMKKIIALSTLSQLGLMMTSLGLNLVDLTFMHMVIHAMFKALLFVSAGTLINCHFHSQDLRWMGNIGTQLPMTSSCIIIANLAMMGSPFLAAFYSKDTILELSMFFFNPLISMIIIYSSLALTSFYSVRFMYYIILHPMNSTSLINITEPNNVKYPMLYLSIPSIMGGMLMNWLLPVNPMFNMLSTTHMLLPLIIVSGGATLFFLKLNLNWSNFMSLIMSMWFLTPLSTQPFINLSFKASKLYLELMDQSWMELVEKNYSMSNIMGLSNKMNLLSDQSSTNFIFACLMTSMMMMFLNM
uniref:NADH-ubiquinone oxidoreductase chain 5 n=1 Tax=Paracanthobdella livanowi TaxID=2905687 RepID=A0A9E8GE90_9ANNE|nr:NADH dehydrogenase subunit 5 [Paracanthobdella livanowi]UZT67753.1 NADH dehydrogenase subunit 5 [Paracanthobdella livanowi]